MKENLIGKYKILDEIGRGGMGIVYRGKQVSLGRLVAIKTLPSDLAQDQEFLERIENEAQILAQFTHPCIVYIHDREKQDDAIYLIMEYVPGITVADRLRQDGPYEVKEAARIIIRVASALDHAHQKGVIHRDIKPSNIMIREDNAVKVTDFGIAKSSEGSDITRIRWTPGTRDYMSPEQAQGGKNIDGRSDIYSLGIVFHLMLTGKFPPYPLPERLPFVSPRYEKIIRKCLAEDRTERYHTANDLVKALEEAERKHLGSQKKKKAEKKPRKISKLAVGAVCVVLVMGLSFWQLDNIKGLFSDNVISSTEPDPQPAPITRENQPAVVPTEETPPISDNQAYQEGLNSSTEEANPVISITENQPIDSDLSIAPTLRPAIERQNEILDAIGGRPEMGAQYDVRQIFSLKTGVIADAGTNPELLYSIKSVLDQMGVARSIAKGGCDLLIELRTNSLEITITLVSNIFGDDRIDSFQESFGFTDEQELLMALETIIQRYYCFNILNSMALLKPVDDNYAVAVSLDGGTNGTFQVGDAIKICMNSRDQAYSMLLSINSEGLYMLYPQTREENVPLNLEKTFCTEPMEVSPPTGNELIVAIIIREKSMVPIDSYLAGDEQVIIEPASWSFDLSISDNAVAYCENLFASLYQSLPDHYSSDSQFFKTYN